MEASARRRRARHGQVDGRKIHFRAAIKGIEFQGDVVIGDDRMIGSTIHCVDGCRSYDDLLVKE